VEAKLGARAVFPRLHGRCILFRVSEQATIFICKAHRLLAATPSKPAKGRSATSLILSWTTTVWAICHLVVETGHWHSHKEIVISPKHIDRISYEESKVFVNVTKKAILEAPQYHVSPLGEAYGDTRNFD
jgi:hypothetical protein